VHVNYHEAAENVKWEAVQTVKHTPIHANKFLCFRSVDLITTAIPLHGYFYNSKSERGRYKDQKKEKNESTEYISTFG
jgi:hypothetical protein